MDRRMNVIIIAKLMMMFVLCCSGAAVLCKHNEREALLTLKQGLTIFYVSGTNLSTWGTSAHKDNMDCCNWDGVTCNNQTGHVTGLDFYYLRGEISSALLELRYLDTLDIDSNDFGMRRIPEFIGSLINLEHLRLTYSNFSGDVPYQLGNLTNLRELDLSDNHNLTSNNLTWLSNLTLLSSLDLSGNQLGGPISWLSNLTLLSKVDLYDNQFDGPFPDLKALSHLTRLFLDSNNLTGQLPTSISQLSSLEKLIVSNNSLEGTISDIHFTQLHNLTYLDLSFNSLSLNFSPNWIPPFQLDIIHLARCNMGPHFPAWIQTQSNFSVLDLSSAGISGELPNWFWEVSHRIDHLNISNNQLSGSIPDLSSNFLEFAEYGPLPSLIIDISKNNFYGPLPSFHPYSDQLYLSQNMFTGSIHSICRAEYPNLDILDLSQNQFSGELPNCWENMTRLIVLNLDDNKFSGHLPTSLGSLTTLEILHIRNNNVAGELPSTLKNMTSLRLIAGGGNKLTGNIPSWMGTLTNLLILSLPRNNFSGSIPQEMCGLGLIQVLDISENNISGKIPRCFNNFTRMIQGNEGDSYSTDVFTYELVFYGFLSYGYKAEVQWKRQESEYKSTLKLLRLIDLSSNKLEGEIPKEIYSLTGLLSLNLSQNGLTGNINSDINQLQMLDSLDLSRNKLSGKIPTGLAELHSLSVLDLSSNNLSGEIPKGTQLQSFNESSYAGNTELCGAPLPKCPQESSPSSPNSGKEEDIEDHGDEGFTTFKSLFLEYCISAVWGYAVGFWVVVGPLLFSRSWRTAYYGYLSKIWDWLYVTITLSWRRLIRYMKSRK